MHCEVCSRLFGLVKKYTLHNVHLSVLSAYTTWQSKERIQISLEYTRAWITQVNRGGLNELNDTAYCLFKEKHESACRLT